MSALDASLLDLDIRAIGDGFRRRAWSPIEVVQAALERIESSEPALHAWVLVDREHALRAAALAEQELGDRHRSRSAARDSDRDQGHFDVAGWPTRCGSAARDDVAPAAANAVSVQALIDGGAVTLGKTTTQEFAAGTISPPARNPWNPSRIPGGSSGGSAAAVAAGACLGAMGSDTGGSIRIPAAACGVTGFKPAFGRSMSPESFRCPGPSIRSVRLRGPWTTPGSCGTYCRTPAWQWRSHSIGMVDRSALGFRGHSFSTPFIRTCGQPSTRRSKGCATRE